MESNISKINLNKSYLVDLKKRSSKLADSKVPKDSVDSVNPGGDKDLSLIEKSIKGWDLLGDKIYQSKALKTFHLKKTRIANVLKRPFRGIIRKVKEWDDDDDLEKIKEESKKKS